MSQIDPRKTTPPYWRHSSRRERRSRPGLAGAPVELVADKVRGEPTGIAPYIAHLMPCREECLKPDYGKDDDDDDDDKPPAD
jgi:hypothetical protein